MPPEVEAKIEESLEKFLRATRQTDDLGRIYPHDLFIRTLPYPAGFLTVQDIRIVQNP